MTDNQISIAYIVKRVRYRHKDNITAEDRRANEKLTHLLHSYEIVYGSLADQGQVMKQIEYRKQKTRKARKYLAQMAQANSKLYFLTLTFNNEKLSDTSELTRHRYASRFLEKHCADYYANIDYGTKNHREHYHAVVALKNDAQPQILREWETNGFIDIKLVQGEKSSSKLGKYLTKLSCHSDKATAGKSFHKRKQKTPITYNPYADTNAYNFVELHDDDELPF